MGPIQVVVEDGNNVVIEVTPTADTNVILDRGIAGPIGPQGPAATIAVGTTTTLAPGASATVSNSGTSSAAVFNFGVPQGPMGATGTAATVAAGLTTTLAPGSSATVTNVGTTSAAVFDFAIPQGLTGNTGPVGPTGSAATIAAGTTTTLAPGSSATVTNAGTSSAAVFDFGIPQGLTGSAATINVGTTTTLPAGSSATVTNVGTSGAAVFDFGIPKGADGAGSGTVTSISGTGSVSGITLSGTVTSSGNLTLGGTLAVTPSDFASQTANTVLASPDGTSGIPTFRAIVAADIPTLNQNTTGTASNVTGTVAVANGGTGATSLTANNVILGNGTSAVQFIAPGTSGNVLTSNGVTWASTIPVSDMVYPGAGVAVSTGTTWTTSLTVPSGALVGTTDTQTLTNKTIEAGTFTNGYTEEVYALGTSGSLTLNPVNGSIQTCALTGNPTFTDSLAAGQSIVLMLTNGASYTVTYPTITWITAAGNAAPTLTANDVLAFWKVSTTLYGAYVGSGE